MMVENDNYDLDAKCLSVTWFYAKYFKLEIMIKKAACCEVEMISKHTL